MTLKNQYLSRARKEKNDEFYTQYEDIESEMDKYKSFIEGKIIYSPADGSNSNFTKYFKDNFNELRLKGYYHSDIEEGCYFYDGTTDKHINGPIDIMTDDFTTVLKKCDVVITNPPFSLFIPFINSIIENEKDYIIVGQQNSISCKDIFQHILDGKSYLDYGFKGIAGYFNVPSYYEDVATAGEHKEGKIRVSGVIWYSSFDISSEKPFIDLKNHFYDENGNPDYENYPCYDNFREISGLKEDCINVNKVKDIPCDYYGYMGVPISFFGKYNPKQFELIQLDHYGPLGNLDNIVNGKQCYRRIIVKLKKQNLCSE